LAGGAVTCGKDPGWKRSAESRFSSKTNQVSIKKRQALGIVQRRMLDKKLRGEGDERPEKQNVYVRPERGKMQGT